VDQSAPFRLRPIRPEDAEIEAAFVRGLSPQSKYFRFLGSLNELTPEMLARFTRIDPDREMALIATTMEAGREIEIGVARFAAHDDGATCEFAIVVADAWQGKGIGTALMESLMDGARERGLRAIEGNVHQENHNMRRLMRRLGFAIETDRDDATLCDVRKEL